MYEIRPLPDHLSKNYEKKDVPHLVIKRSVAPFQVNDDIVGKHHGKIL